MKYKHNQNGAYALYEKNGEWRESASVRNEQINEWPDESRIDTIGSNGNTGEHYDEVLHVTVPSPKHDQGKARYDLLPPHALDEMALVLTFGANKYSAEGWRTVENARRRYLAAAGRHWQALLRGETHDSESGLHHAAHLMCCAAFIAELDMELE